jgi:uncharacterized protein (DUF433 family)
MGETAAKPYVWTDEHGVMRVGNTQVMLEGVVYPFEQGESAESIRRAYSSLSLAEVYGAIAYYLDHKDEVRAYLDRQEALWQKMRTEQDRNPPPVIQRLKALMAARSREGAA